MSFINDDLDQIKGFITSTTNTFSDELNSNIDATKVLNELNEASRLGIKSLEEIGGVISLNQVPDMLSHVEGSVPTQILGHIPIAKLTERMKDLEADLKPTAAAATKTLNSAITNGTLAIEVNLNEVLSLGTIEAMSASIKKAIPNVTKEKITNVIETAVLDINEPIYDVKSKIDNSFEQAIEDLDVVLPALKNNIDNIVSTVTGTSTVKPGISGLLNTVSTSVLNFANFTSGAFNSGFGTLVENAIENTFQQGSNILNGVATKGGVLQNIKLADKKKIFELVKADNILGASKILSKYSDLPEDELVAALRKIDNRLSKFISTRTDETRSSAAITRDLKNIKADWNQGFPKNPDSYFKNYIIFSAEELDTEIATIKRPFTELIIGFTGSAVDQTIDMYSYHRRFAENWRSKNGFTWHYYLNKSGLIQRVRPVEYEIGNNNLPSEKNHSERSIFLLVDGGTTTPWYNGFDYKRHAVKNVGINSEQYYVLNKFLTKLYTYYPGTQVFGEHEINKNKFPYMDVKSYIKSKYNKENIFDPLERDSLTLEELRKGKL